MYIVCISRLLFSKPVIPVIDNVYRMTANSGNYKYMTVSLSEKCVKSLLFIQEVC